MMQIHISSRYGYLRWKIGIVKQAIPYTFGRR
jgi:hypothetical protein